MTISNQTSSVTLNGDGVTTIFGYSFNIPSESDAVVTLLDVSSGGETPLTLTVDYTISGIGSDDGGNVTLLAIVPTEDQQLEITRVLPLTQDLSLSEETGFFPSLVMGQLDKIVMMVQQINEAAAKVINKVGSITSYVAAAATSAGAASDAAATASDAASDAVGSAADAASSAADAAASAATMTPLADQINAATDAAPTDDDYAVFRDTATGNLIKRSWGNLKTLLAGTFQPLKAILTALGNLANASGFLKNDGAGNLSWVAAGKGVDAIIEHQQPSGTSAGGITAGSTTTIPINTKVLDPNSYVTLSSNQFSLPAGTWEIAFFTPFYATGSVQAWLQNVTDASVAFRGSSAHSLATSPTESYCLGKSRVTIAASKTFALLAVAAATQATNGLGVAAGRGTEVYAHIEITKVS